MVWCCGHCNLFKSHQHFGLGCLITSLLYIKMFKSKARSYKSKYLQPYSLQIIKISNMCKMSQCHRLNFCHKPKTLCLLNSDDLAWKFSASALCSQNLKHFFTFISILMVAQQVAHPQPLEAQVIASSAQAVQTKCLSYSEEAATHEPHMKLREHSLVLLSPVTWWASNCLHLHRFYLLKSESISLVL